MDHAIIIENLLKDVNDKFFNKGVVTVDGGDLNNVCKVPLYTGALLDADSDYVFPELSPFSMFLSYKTGAVAETPETP